MAISFISLRIKYDEAKKPAGSSQSLQLESMKLCHFTSSTAGFFCQMEQKKVFRKMHLTGRPLRGKVNLRLIVEVTVGSNIANKISHFLTT